MNDVIEAAIRRELNKRTGELTKADLGKVTVLELGGKQLTDITPLKDLAQLTLLNLDSNKLTSVNGLKKLTKLPVLILDNNPDLTKAQVDELKKTLPKCKIRSNPKK